jgi:hypothetical protein
MVKDMHSRIQEAGILDKRNLSFVHPGVASRLRNMQIQKILNAESNPRKRALLRWELLHDGPKPKPLISKKRFCSSKVML